MAPNTVLAHAEKSAPIFYVLKYPWTFRSLAARAQWARNCVERIFLREIARDDGERGDDDDGAHPRRTKMIAR